MSLERITTHLPPSLPENVEVYSYREPMSRYTKVACIGTAGVGIALIALFIASQNAQFSALAQRLGPGGSAICGITGTVLIQASVIPPLCSDPKIETSEYLEDPAIQQQLNTYILNIKSIRQKNIRAFGKQLGLRPELNRYIRMSHHTIYKVKDIFVTVQNDNRGNISLIFHQTKNAMHNSSRP